MQNLKKSFGFIALFVGVLIAVAFKAPEAKQESQNAESWFIYDGSGSVTDPSNYEKLPGVPSCEGDGARCAILAEEDGESGIPTVAGAQNPTEIRQYL